MNPFDPHIILTPNLIPLGSKQVTFAQFPSYSFDFFLSSLPYSIFTRVPALDFISGYKNFYVSKRASLNPTWISGFPSLQCKFRTYTFFFHVYFFKCSSNIELFLEHTSIHSYQLAKIGIPFSKIMGRNINASDITFPFGPKNKLYRDIFGCALLLFLSQSKEILFVASPCKNFLVYAPCTTMILRSVSLAKHGLLNTDLNSLLRTFEKNDVGLQSSCIGKIKYGMCTIQ